MAKVALSLGSNLGDKRANIAKALSALDEGGARIMVRSADYRTEPWGPIAQDWFVNACALAETDLAPDDLLALCLRVERQLGRIREVKWGPRVIDIDILTYDDLELITRSLTLPHPFIGEREFVLVPLAEIASDLKLGGRPIMDMLAGLNRGDVAKLT
ncbi:MULTISPECIES: 2-amino-4-hydroxy-6-hydroxymethyldihydropteridine diphosphokinase [Microvirga]|uniref:2-amino-4-hydroxy-6- hydroxymethyldihydropteridine diphosphokinase n=1 Tax=Microvirga TaxID=186650 RepID=UPI000E0DFCF0|nr:MULTISPECIES: 2-amino-4-hydroxy-6-hydroxymethyldihydropteridine diphosphokinase [Microvirga]MBQ0819950.1 2-amino-4-hydroxy-6-hydroxymethyldihydropteridine diphosphokinase [Microvirga sp. HBU67558]